MSLRKQKLCINIQGHENVSSLCLSEGKNLEPLTEVISLCEKSLAVKTTELHVFAQERLAIMPNYV